MKKRLIHSVLLSTLLLGVIAQPALDIQRILAEEVVEENKGRPKKIDDSNEKESGGGHTENGQTQHTDLEKKSEEKIEKQSKPEKVTKSFELAPQGNVKKHRDEEYRTYQHSNKIPTGLYVENTESFTVTTDKNNVKIIIGQYGTYDYLNNNEDIDFTTYELEVGENTITFEKGTGMIYLQNFSEEELAQVTIEDTLEVPTFQVNKTTTEEWKEQMARLTDAPFVELVGDYVFGTFQYNQAEDFLNPDTVNDRLTYWDQVFLYQNEVIGTSLTGTGINKKYNNRVHIINPDTGAGWAYAGSGRISFQKDSGAGKSILSDLPEQDQWGLWHEMGHTYQNPYYEASFLGEVTVNIPALVIQDKLGIKNRFEGSSNVARIQSFIETTGNKSFAAPGYDNDSNHWVWLGLFEQLRRAYGNNFYSHLNYNYRLLDNVPVPSDDEGKFQLFMKMSSQTAQRDLSEFFEKWGLYPNQDTLEEMKKYSKPSQSIWENIYNGTIVDEEIPLLKVPQADKTPGDYILGTVPAELNPTTFFTNVKDSAGNPADQSMNYLWNITNPASKGKILSAKIEDSAGNKNKFSPLETNFKYGNALSMHAYRSEERLIITLQKTSKTIETFSDETLTTRLTGGDGEYVRFVLYNNNLQAKKEVVANAEDTPFDFVKNTSNLPYEEGDYIKMTIRDAKKLESYTNSEISMSRSDSTKEEWFRIKNDTFERVDYVPHGTPVEVETPVGQKVDAKALVQDITDAFGPEDVQVTFEKEPNVNKSGDVTASLLLTNKMGYQTKVQSVIHVGHGNALSLRAYALSDERAVIRLDKDKQTIETFANPDRQTPIDGSNGLAWRVTLYDGKTNAVKKEVSAQREDLPFDFATNLSNVSYENGDYIKLYNRRSGFTFNYRDNEQTDESFGTDEYLVIQNNQFVKMLNEAPTLQSEDTISYERGMLISPEQFLEDIQAKTQAGNQLTTTFDENTLKEVGVVQVEVKATNPISQEEVSKTVTVTVTPSILAYNEYKRSYWRDYGFVLEGNAGIQDTAFPSKDSVTKVLEILDAEGQIVDTVQAVNTNWYESLNYSGYQVNIAYTKLQALEAGNYILQIHLTSADGLDEVLPITSPLNLFGWIGEFQDDMSQIASGFAGKNVLNFTETNRSLGLNVTYGDAVFNKLSQYTAPSGNHVIDGWIATDFDFQTAHTKELIVEDAMGNEVLRKTAPTWDITQTFKVDVKEEWKHSGFQASIPADKTDNGNKYFIEIKDGQGNEVTKTEVK